METNTVAAQRVHQTHIQYAEDSVGQDTYACINRQIPHSANTAGENLIIHNPETEKDYSVKASTVNQVPNNLSQGTTPDQLLAQGNGVYLSQQHVDPHMTHTVNAEPTASPVAASASASAATSASAAAATNTGGVASTVSGNADAATNTSLVSGGNPKFPHIIRISPTTVHWLMQNYEVAEGEVLPLSTFYCHYLRHCKRNKLCPVRTSALGKIVRSVFCDMTVRKIITRRIKKYYFHGIRVIS
jgi:hypothetical protein